MRLYIISFIDCVLCRFLRFPDAYRLPAETSFLHLSSRPSPIQDLDSLQADNPVSEPKGIFVTENLYKVSILRVSFSTGRTIFHIPRQKQSRTLLLALPQVLLPSVVTLKLESLLLWKALVFILN